VLSQYADVHPGDWRFKASVHGKPRIVAPRGYSSLRFSLTHTEGLMVCLVSRCGEVGVDAEEVSRRVNVDEVARHFFAPSERAELAALAPEKRGRRFFEIWVLKEAYLKGRGCGLSVSPQRIGITWGPKGKPNAIRDWQLALYRPTPQHVAATAIRASNAVRVVWRDAAGLFKT
jgi:4'-phosphopantetheinyl transferase